MRKHPAFLLATLLLLSLATVPARAGLFLSELCDPLNNYPTDRFIEIYNSGPAAVNLTGWSIVAVANGADALTWTLSGSIAPGQAKVAGNPAPVTGFTVDFPNAAWTTAVTGQGSYNWNGKVGDGAKLMNGATLVDYVLAPGDLFNDRDLVRIASVTNPNPVYTASEWTATPVTLATDGSPGSHNGSSPPLAGPAISGTVTVPASPTAGVAVDVQATVVAAAAWRPVNAVTLSWGNSAGSLTNVIGMPLVSGDLYQTSAQIPGMAGGATVYYRVAAEDDSASSQSSILSYTIPGGGGGVPPSVYAVGQMSDSTLLVHFSEPVEQVTAETPGNYAVGALVAVAATRDAVDASKVWITVRSIPAGTRTLTVNGVSDLVGDIAYGATRSYNHVDVSIPPGYYASAIGLKGSALRVALHNIIKAHTTISYSAVLGAFQTTDVKPNGKVWDPYSDVPGGTAPYEYSFGQTGSGGSEGLGYNREHSFPQSWFNGSGPAYSDVFQLYPTDAYVNNRRANYPFGEVGAATWTSLNGSKLGASVTAGYSGTVFEPIDAFKGDLARSQFYMESRYFNEDASWPGSPSNDGAILYKWAADQFYAWCTSDPVSWKERMRNGAVYAIQHNRNPFIDHPEFVAALVDSNAVTGVEPGGPRAQGLRNSPNPFVARTTIGFALARAGDVSLEVYDLHGRRVRALAEGRRMEPGTHAMEWDGRDQSGAAVPAGLYFCKLDAGELHETQRIVRIR